MGKPRWSSSVAWVGCYKGELSYGTRCRPTADCVACARILLIRLLSFIFVFPFSELAASEPPVGRPLEPRGLGHSIEVYGRIPPALFMQFARYALCEESVTARNGSTGRDTRFHRLSPDSSAAKVAHAKCCSTASRALCDHCRCSEGRVT